MDGTLHSTQSLWGVWNSSCIYKTQRYSSTILRKIFPKHVKVEGMIHFNFCHPLVENIMNSVPSSILQSIQKVKICHLFKNYYIWAAQKLTGNVVGVPPEKNISKMRISGVLHPFIQWSLRYLTVFRTKGSREPQKNWRNFEISYIIV